MYLVTIHVPIYVRGPERFVTTEWKRSLALLRDSLNGVYGPLTVAAPALPADGPRDQPLERITRDDDIVLMPSFDLRIRARDYWRVHRRRWRQFVRGLAERAEVVHAGLDDLYRPIMYDAWNVARRLGRPTVFVQDTDIAEQVIESAAACGFKRRLCARAYSTLYARCCAFGVAHATLSLLKGRRLMQRYGPAAHNAREIHDTSHTSDEIVRADHVERRLASLSGRGLRFVYCGRLVPEKGLARSIDILAEARRRGADVKFDIIGDGPQAPRLREQIQRLGMADVVRLLGAIPYGRSLLKMLADYDAMLFTPGVDCTPRMIFDGYAAGLPLVGTEVDYICERQRDDGAVCLLPCGDDADAAGRIVMLSEDRQALAALTGKALEAARIHAADQWYRRRAEWTFEAIPPAPAYGGLLAPVI